MTEEAVFSTSAAPLAGRRALVTAGSRNLGAVIAERLAEAGAQVAVTYHSEESDAAALIGSFRKPLKGSHAIVGSDLTSSAAASRAVEEASDRLGGGVDVLVNNFGPWAGGTYADLDASEWQLGMDGNLRSVYLATRAVVPHMRSGGWGRVINISAGSAFVLDHSIYGLAKNAITFLTSQLAIELGPEITVNAIAPGQVDESCADMEAAEPGSVSTMLARTPAGRFVTRREVGDMVTAMCSPLFDTVTGATIPMDGGWRLPRSS